MINMNALVRLINYVISRLKRNHKYCKLDSSPSINISELNNDWNKLALAIVEKHRTLDGRMPKRSYDEQETDDTNMLRKRNFDVYISSDNEKWNTNALAILAKQKQ